MREQGWSRVDGGEGALCPLQTVGEITGVRTGVVQLVDQVVGPIPKRPDIGQKSDFVGAGVGVGGPWGATGSSRRIG